MKFKFYCNTAGIMIISLIGIEHVEGIQNYISMTL